MVAVEQDLVDQRADLVVRRLDQRQPQVARRVLDAVEIARDPPLGGEDDDPGGVRELLALGVVDVAEADAAASGLDRRLRPGEEVPAGVGALAAVAAEDLGASSPRPAPASRCGSMLTMTTSKSLPGSSVSVFRLAVTPLSTMLQSIGQW